MRWRHQVGFLIALAMLRMVCGAQVYSRLPLSFEPNQGQTDPRVQYLSRGRGYTLLLSANSMQKS